MHHINIMRSPSINRQTIVCCAAAIVVQTTAATAFIPPTTITKHTNVQFVTFSSKTNREFEHPQDVFDLNIIQQDDVSSFASSLPSTSFVDIESDYDHILSSNEVSTTITDSSELIDDEDQDRILTEREDRLFLTTNVKKIETCILIGVEDLSSLRRNKKEARKSNIDLASYNLDFSLEESMIEMRELIKTAGLDLRGEITQRLQEINPKTYIGTGKVIEAQTLLNEMNAELEKEGQPPCCTVVFDAELTPGQQKALENAFNKKVIENDFLGSKQGDVINVVDRTALILDIFAQHAKTREGKLQVDLALHEYRKPRLTRMWTHLERQSGAGGVGLRGPGETQLEVDKRILRDRIIVLKEKINEVQKQRDLHRRSRKKKGLPVLALVGYTNAGKSTLLNSLTKAGILAENILFATLDPTTRRVKLPGYKTHPEVLLTDTVGFIQKLPTQLVAAFRATLEEVSIGFIVLMFSPCYLS
jgi:50S ribosomal subunit-associated GTPase HflX